MAIDSGTVTQVAKDASTVLNMAYVAILAVVGFVTYLVGLVHGKNKVTQEQKPVESGK